MRRTEMPPREAPLRTTTELARGKGISRKPSSRRARSTVRMREVRPDLEERSAGACELCGLSLVRSERGFVAQHHHRLSRARGGNDEIDNALLLHPQCHEKVHGRPVISKDEGWLLPSRSVPAECRVTYMSRPALLAVDGSVNYLREHQL